jgi:hypothetical protein
MVFKFRKCLLTTVFTIISLINYKLICRAKFLFNYLNELAKEITIAESFQFDFGTIETATKKFSKDKKLAEGGFGEVYKVRDEHSFIS